MPLRKKVFPFFLLFSSSFSIDLEKIRLSGYFRLRSWYLFSKTPTKKVEAPIKDPTQEITFSDLFFRQRIHYFPSSYLALYTTWDVGTIRLGKEDQGTSLGTGKTILKTKHLYFLYQPQRKIRLLGGLLPFRLPGGYILSREGAGLLLKIFFLDIAHIKATERSDIDLAGDDFPNNDYNDRDIYYIKAQFLLPEILEHTLYFAHDEDREPKNLKVYSWAGYHIKIFLSPDLSIEGSILYNYPKEEYQKASFFFSQKFQYTPSPSLRIQLASYQVDTQFSSISPSFRIGYIFMDNSGGFLIHKANTFRNKIGSLLEIGFLPWGFLDLSFQGSIYHQKSTYEYLGGEINLKALLKIEDHPQFFLIASSFFPTDAYTRRISFYPGRKKPIEEFTIGIEFSF